MRPTPLVLILLLIPLPGAAKLVQSVEPGVPEASAVSTAAREITAFPAGGAIRVDGVLDEPCWQEGLWIGDWRLKDAPDQHPEAQTRFKVRFDARNVYVGVVADEPNMAYLRESYGAAHDTAAYSDDCIEVWLSPGHLRQRGYHFAFSVAGGVWDGVQWETTSLDPQAAIGSGRKATRHEDKAWDSTARAAFAKAGDHWTCEAQLPATDLRMADIVPGSLWGFNIGRERWAFPEGGRGEYSSLTSVFSWPMTSFANLRLGLSPVGVSNLNLGAVGRGENQARFDCRAARRDLEAVDVRLTARDTEEHTVRFWVKLDGDKPVAVAQPYTLAECPEAHLVLELLRPGTEEVLFRTFATRDLSEPLRAYPRSNLAYLGRDPWWVDLQLAIGGASLARSQLQVEVVSPTGRVRGRQRLKDLTEVMRLNIRPRAIGPAGQYTLRFTVVDGKQELGRAELPLRLIRPPA
jgi:hypothetical protein